MDSRTSEQKNKNKINYIKMKNLKFALFVIFFQIEAKVPVQIGILLNPSMYFVNTDTLNGVSKQQQWGSNATIRVGFDLSSKVTIGFGAGMGYDYEKVNFTYYNFLINRIQTGRDKNILNHFSSKHNKTSYILNPYFNYKIKLTQKFGIILEFGNRFIAKYNSAETFKIDNQNTYPIDQTKTFEFENNIYLRPGLYYDILPKCKITLHYLSFGHAFGKKLDYNKLIKTSQYTKYVDDVNNPNYNLMFPYLSPTLGLNNLDLTQNFNQFQFLYNLSSIHIGIFLTL